MVCCRLLQYNITVINSTDEHIDPTAELSIETVKSRAIRGIYVLMGRSAFLTGVTFAAWFLLTIILDSAEIGVFIVVSAVINFLRYFSDVGLAASLIQKKSAPTESELRTSFTIQMVLVSVLTLGVLLATPYISSAYDLSSEGTYLLLALVGAFFIASLKTIPSVLLERKLDFQKLIIPDLVENLVYSCVAVILAYKGLGITSFTWAIILRGLSGLVVIYLVSPWKPGFHFSTRSLKELLKFGVPYQLNSFLATIKDDGITAVLGGIIGVSGVGYIGWAQKMAQMPLRLVMDNVMRVTFPAFARMQDDKKDLVASVNKTLLFISVIIFPLTFGFVILSPLFINIIPKYEKWEPALIPLLFISINSVFASVTTPLTNMLMAIGKVKITFYLMIMWTVLTWVFVPLLAYNYGVNGASLGYSIVGSSSIVAMFIAHKYVKYSYITSVLKPLFAALVMGYVVLVCSKLLPLSILSLIALTLIGGIVYLGTLYLVIGKGIISDVKRLVKIRSIKV
jgi:O-antigen/teichoic acid export membrane protein